MRWFFLVLSLVLAAPAFAANDTTWHRGPVAGSGNCVLKASDSSVSSCFWNFDTLGQSIIVNATCENKAIAIEGADFEVHPYHCTGTEFTSCFRIGATNLETGQFGDTILSEDDRELISVPWTSLLFDVQSGSGIVRIDCGG